MPTSRHANNKLNSTALRCEYGTCLEWPQSGQTPPVCSASLREVSKISSTATLTCSCVESSSTPQPRQFIRAYPPAAPYKGHIVSQPCRGVHVDELWTGEGCLFR